MSDKNIVAAFYDPSDLTDIITVSMHCMYIYKAAFKHACSFPAISENCACLSWVKKTYPVPIQTIIMPYQITLHYNLM